MPIKLNSSMPMFAMTQLNLAQRDASTSMQRLSSGLRVNSASDDATGLANTAGMTSQIRGYNQSIRNANDGISLLQVAEGTLGETTNVLQRMRELTVQAGNDTNSQNNRMAIANEITMLSNSIENMMNQTQFNGIKLFSERQHGFNIGLEGGNITLDIGDLNYSQLGLHQTETINKLQGVSLTGDPITYSDQIMINGYALDINQPISSATDIANAFNQLSDKTNVTVHAVNQIVLPPPDFTQSPSSSAGIKINDIDIDLTNSQNINEIIEQINLQLANTDIIASETEQGELSIISRSGADISIEQSETNLLQTGIGSTHYHGTLSFESEEDSITISSGLENQTEQLNALTKIGLNKETGFKTPQKNINVLNPEGVSDSLNIIDNALQQITNERASYGAQQNRLAYTINHLETMSINSEASRSRILDTDFAAESAALAKNQLLMQTSSAMLIRFTKMHSQQILSLLNSLR